MCVNMYVLWWVNRRHDTNRDTLYCYGTTSNNNTQWTKFASWNGLGLKDTVGGVTEGVKESKVLELLIETCREQMPLRYGQHKCEKILLFLRLAFFYLFFCFALAPHS